ncbi:MAG: sporulation transcriptional regulator SpoIIID, partial [Erysipelotrichaceae bacterium]|nr:sporulation transcriptional regulator SpoIIID [Erysipelotrichaceae bacterium]
MRDYSLDKDEVLKRKVIEVADYVISTKASTRATANYFTSCRFPISNATVHTYLNKRLKEIDFVRYQQVREILEGNSPESILDAEVRKRIYQAVALLLQGDTISQ